MVETDCVNPVHFQYIEAYLDTVRISHRTKREIER